LIAQKIKLKYGSNALFEYNLNKEFLDSQSDRPDRKDKKVTYEPGIGFVLGIDYQVSESFSIGVEIFAIFSIYYWKIYG